MAFMIPETLKKDATHGERKLFRVLRENLPEDCIVYYEPFVGSRRPDYVVIIPSKGLLVLETKSYKLENIVFMDQNKWTLLVDGVEKPVVSPLVQARNYSFSIGDKLSKDPYLRKDMNGGQRLKFWYAFGVVLTSITRNEVIDYGINEIIPDNLLITKDELDNTNTTQLYEQLVEMFDVAKNRDVNLTPEDIDRIRYHLFPEIRIGREKAYNEGNLLRLRTLPAMDLYQESLSKQIGSGHRLIRGVAGSGKTLVLVARAKYLASSNPKHKIAILCFGVVLARKIKSMIGPEFGQIRVWTFHEFLQECFSVSNDSLVFDLAKSIKSGERPRPIFDHILIDEAQDFESSWLTLVSMCLSDETKSLLIAEDKVQDIFKRKTSYLQYTGLDFRGRSRILNINYRNTKQVAKFSWDFYTVFVKNNKDSDIIKPEYTKRSGSDICVKRFKNTEEELCWVSEEIRRLYYTGVANLSDIAILYRAKKFNSTDFVSIALNTLKKYDLDHVWVSKDRKTKSEFSPDDNKIKILTLDSAKGLDFKVVFIINIENLPFPLEEDVEREASLLYIGMTRSTDRLYLTYSGESRFTAYLGRFEEVSK